MCKAILKYSICIFGNESNPQKIRSKEEFLFDLWIFVDT